VDHGAQAVTNRYLGMTNEIVSRIMAKLAKLPTGSHQSAIPVAGSRCPPGQHPITSE